MGGFIGIKFKDVIWSKTGISLGSDEENLTFSYKILTFIFDM